MKGTKQNEQKRKKADCSQRKIKGCTPVEVNDRKHYMDLRPLHYEYLMATYHDGSMGMYLCTPDGSIEKDDESVIEGLPYAI